MADVPGPERYFLAVWPDDEVRERLVEWAASLRVDPPARRVPGPNLHITLAFLGRLDAPQLRAVREVADRISWNGAHLHLDRIGYWKRSRIVWAGSRDGSEDLAALAEGLRDGLRRRGFRIDERPFAPHVTLYRKARRRPRWQRQSVAWRIDEYCLMESHLVSDGARYEVVGRWSTGDDVK